MGWGIEGAGAGAGGGGMEGAGGGGMEGRGMEGEAERTSDVININTNVRGGGGTDR